ncbi:Photosystem I PsaA/PsaB [Cynara cardunculus var. scolymus]|uniref:Photosystem I PsaA/PsaB n=1 Tax=Cynara cardunculus var. scolymus TaxID=59895 RepID=A0A124SGM1_CYNCS|nr:Photosystem I PsaA/PsaB [Cynara cardunculus var. scolymus]
MEKLYAGKEARWRNGEIVLIVEERRRWEAGGRRRWSGRGYWQELIESVVWAHNKLKVAPATHLRALSIVQGRAVGVTHYLLGGIATTKHNAKNVYLLYDSRKLILRRRGEKSFNNVARMGLKNNKDTTNWLFSIKNFAIHVRQIRLSKKNYLSSLW